MASIRKRRLRSVEGMLAFRRVVRGKESITDRERTATWEPSAVVCRPVATLVNRRCSHILNGRFDGQSAFFEELS